MIRRLFTTALPLVVIATAAFGLTSCDTYPSGCMSFGFVELPYPNYWDNNNRAVYHGDTNGLHFLGVSAGSPYYDGTRTWRGPSQYTGWNEYLSADRCFQTGGQSSQP